MNMLLTVLRRTLGDAQYAEPKPHFHASSSENFPEVCFEGACNRPHLAA
jgi:hypothetical protein